jgi:hypothetical protein
MTIDEAELSMAAVPDLGQPVARMWNSGGDPVVDGTREPVSR